MKYYKYFFLYYTVYCNFRDENISNNEVLNKNEYKKIVRNEFNYSCSKCSQLLGYIYLYYILEMS